MSKGLIAWNPASEMLDEERVAQALFQCLKEENIEAFKEILSAHLDIKIKTRLAKEQGIPVRTLFDALSEKGNPSLKTLAKIVRLAYAS